MKNRLYRLLLTFGCLVASAGVYAQPGDAKLRSPFDFELLLSANFGELRSNHFHAGIDVKTGGVTGKHIKCVADGYICRAKVQAGGYGLALYVMHDGYMTVYAHLDRFPASIAKRVRNYQYEKERFEVDMHFSPGEYPVKQGEFLAYAGNSGYSFGPHLHFEVRDASGNELYNPLPFYKSKIADTRAPKATALIVYPRQGKGTLSNGTGSQIFRFKGNVLPDTIEAWGDIAFGIEALDYMNSTNNKYGVYRIELFADGVRCFESQMDNFSFSENRLILAGVDKGREKRDDGTFQNLFIDPNNPFRESKADASRGWVNINQERLYNIECHLSDCHGNKSKYSIVVRGKRCDVPQPATMSAPLRWNVENVLEAPGARLVIPKNQMFDDASLAIANDSVCNISGGCLSTGEDVYFRNGAKLSLAADDIPVADKSKLYISEITAEDTAWVGGKYSDGWVTATIPSQGCYAISADTVPPVLRPVNESGWMKKARLVFDLYDNETTVSSFRGTLNGKFVLFKYSSKERRLTFDFRQENIRSGNHKLKVVVTDAYGNETVFEKNIRY